MTTISKLCSLRAAFKLNVSRLSSSSIRPFSHIKCNHNTINQTQKRFKSMFPKFKVNEQSLKVKDNVPDEFNLIYRNTMSNYLLGSQIVSVLSCAIVGFYVWKSDIAIKQYESYMPTWKDQPIPVDNELLVYLTAILALSIGLQYVIKKMPIRVYNYAKDDKYVFVYYNVLPFTTKRATCELKDIRKLPLKSNPLLPWTDSRYEVHRNYGTILIDNFFKSPAEQNIMLGLQKRYVEKEDE